MDKKRLKKSYRQDVWSQYHSAIRTPVSFPVLHYHFASLPPIFLAQLHNHILMMTILPTSQGR